MKRTFRGNAGRSRSTSSGEAQILLMDAEMTFGFTKWNVPRSGTVK